MIESLMFIVGCITTAIICLVGLVVILTGLLNVIYRKGDHAMKFISYLRTTNKGAE